MTKDQVLAHRRIQAVRALQMRAAADAWMAARDQEADLCRKSERLQSLAADMQRAAAHTAMGAALHAQMELAQRLRSAGEGMAAPIAEAQRRAAFTQDEHRLARQQHEIAGRLVERTAEAHARQMEQARMAQPLLRRSTKREDEA